MFRGAFLPRCRRRKLRIVTAMFAPRAPLSAVSYWNVTQHQEAHEILYAAKDVYVHARDNVTHFPNSLSTQSRSTPETPWSPADKKGPELDGALLGELRGGATLLFTRSNGELNCIMRRVRLLHRGLWRNLLHRVNNVCYQREGYLRYSGSNTLFLQTSITVIKKRHIKEKLEYNLRRGGLKVCCLMDLNGLELWQEGLREEGSLHWEKEIIFTSLLEK